MINYYSQAERVSKNWTCTRRGLKGRQTIAQGRATPKAERHPGGSEAHPIPPVPYQPHPPPWHAELGGRLAGNGDFCFAA